MREFLSGAELKVGKFLQSKVRFFWWVEKVIFQVLVRMFVGACEFEGKFQVSFW